MPILTLPEPPELTAFEVPPVEDYMKAQQKTGRDLCAEERYMRTWRWLRERRCEKLVNPQLVEQYAMSVARWIQCEEALSEFGFLAKHPTTGNAIASPFIKTLQDFIKQSNMLWAQIYTVVQDNCSEQYSGPNPQDDVMEVFDMVQAEMKRRNSQKGKHSGVGFFASRIICGDCGGWFGSKVWHSTSKYRRTIWQCNSKFKNGEKCSTPHLNEDEIKRRFLIASNRLLTGKNNLAADFESIKTTLFDTSTLEAECDELQSEMTIVAEMIEKCVDDNAHRRQDQGEYNRRYSGLVDRFEKAKSRYTELTEQIQERTVRRRSTESFLAVTLKRKTPLTEFDEQFWYATVETATVYNDGRIIFRFKDGTEIEG